MSLQVRPPSRQTPVKSRRPSQYSEPAPGPGGSSITIGPSDTSMLKPAYGVFEFGVNARAARARPQPARTPGWAPAQTADCPCRRSSPTHWGRRTGIGVGALARSPTVLSGCQASERRVRARKIEPQPARALGGGAEPAPGRMVAVQEQGDAGGGSVPPPAFRYLRAATGTRSARSRPRCVFHSCSA